MSIPADLKYSKSHEWARLEADASVSVGITGHAQELLGDMVFIEPPEVGRKFASGEECGVVESVKAASDIYAPIGGEVTAVNSEVIEAPEKINADPYASWIFRLQPTNVAELNNLLDAAGYQAVVDAEDH
jgi:glycine cleavage system H protein